MKRMHSTRNGLPSEQWSLLTQWAAAYDALDEQAKAQQTRTNAAVLRQRLGL